MRRPVRNFFFLFAILILIPSLSFAFKKEISLETLGPFPLDEKSFSLLVESETIVSEDETGFKEKTVRKFEIKDEKRAVHFKKVYSYDILPYGFSEAIAVQPHLLEGEKGKGLILYYDVVPSAPSSGHFCQIFALKEGDLDPLSLPLSVYGKITPLSKGSSEGVLKLAEGDTIEFRLWTGNYQIIVPVRIKFDEMKVETPASGIYKVSTENTPEELRKPTPGARVSLFGIKDTKSVPRQVTIKEDSMIEFVEAWTGIFVEEYEGALYISEEDPWLKVRVDGEEGWVKYEEDLSALGLPMSG